MDVGVGRESVTENKKNILIILLSLTSEQDWGRERSDYVVLFRGILLHIHVIVLMLFSGFIIDYGA